MTDFVSDLADVLGNDIREYRDVACDVYAALSNVNWTNDDDSEFSCSWRYAGGVVADIRGKGEDYIDFYCSGNEGHVTDFVRDALATRGWKPGDPR